jgi:hypothetical protein
MRNLNQEIKDEITSTGKKTEEGEGEEEKGNKMTQKWRVKTKRCTRDEIEVGHASRPSQ